MNPSAASIWLLRHGLIVFLLGMCSGFAMVKFPSIYVTPRLALSSHLLGAMGGMFLIAAGLMTNRVRMSPLALTIAFWLLVYGAYGNWLAALLGAIFGTGTMTPVASDGHVAAEWQENIVNALLNTCGTASFAGAVMFLVGLRREPLRTDS